CSPIPVYPFTEFLKAPKGTVNGFSFRSLTKCSDAPSNVTCLMRIVSDEVALDRCVKTAECSLVACDGLGACILFMTPKEVVMESLGWSSHSAFIKYGMPVILSGQTTTFTSQNSPRTLDLPKPISTTYNYNFNYQSSSSALPIAISSVVAIIGFFIALIFISRWYATKRINEIAADPEKMRALEAKAMNGSLQAMRTLAAVR
ncbi:hypothetical protein HDU67_001528, partial [Dinochytrium kinnereticum]